MQLEPHTVAAALEELDDVVDELSVVEVLLVASLDPEVLASLFVGVAVGLPVSVGVGLPGVGLPVGLTVGLGFPGLGFGPPGFGPPWFGPPEELPGPIDGTFYYLVSLPCEVQVWERKARSHRRTKTSSSTTSTTAAWTHQWYKASWITQGAFTGPSGLWCRRYRAIRQSLPCWYLGRYPSDRSCVVLVVCRS